MRYRIALLVVAVWVPGSGCARIEEVIRGPAPGTPHEQYLEGLREAGLAETALASRWREAAERALAEAVPIEAPFEELTYFPADEPSAAGYRISVRRGQVLLAEVVPEPLPGGRIFLDLFELGGDTGPRRLASAADGARRLEFAPPRDGEFILRVQPELLRTVRLQLSVTRAATLAFPVEGGGTDDIGSRFGAARDGGRRSHHGVDIFAPRGTPVLAPTDATVSRVDTTDIGGLVIWLRDARRRQSIYYAHLDRHLVSEGRRVRAGDTLGLVGNSGNARTTPPHLHFGIYRRGQGPIDPYAFIEAQPADPPPIRVETESLGSWARTTGRARARLADSEEDRTLPPHTVVRVLGTAGRAYRVGLPDGRAAWLSDASLEILGTEVEALAAATATEVLDRPVPDAVPTGRVSPGDTLAVLGRFEGYLLVQSSDRDRGWLPPDRTRAGGVAAGAP